MKFAKYGLASAIALAGTASAFAVPETKLVSRLDKGLVQAIWCSALFFEQSYSYDLDDAAAIRYENLAFDLGERIDAMLSEEHGMRQEEIDEIWTLFDDGAYDLAVAERTSFTAQLDGCERNFDNLI